MGFFDGGARSLSFGNLNDQTWLNRWRGGVIVDIRDETQQTVWKTNLPVWADAGQTVPKMQLPIILRCDGQGLQAAGMGAAGIGDERTDPTDDGRRTLYVKGTLRFDIGNKLRELAADPNNLIGGELYLKMTGTRQTENGTGRTWEILFFPPPANASAGSFFAQEQQPQTPAVAHPVTGQQGVVVGQVQGFNPNTAQAPAAPAAGASPFGAAPVQQQAPQAPAQGSPFGAAPPAAPAQAPSNNPFG